MEVRVIKRLGHLNPEANYELGPYHWDIGFEKAKVVVDLDSRQFHASEDAFIVDRWKPNDAQQRGWTALRFTDLCANFRINRVVEDIEAAVRHSQQPRAPVWTHHPSL